jgi:hypothetical protein
MRDILYKHTCSVDLFVVSFTNHLYKQRSYESPSYHDA